MKPTRCMLFALLLLLPAWPPAPARAQPTPIGPGVTYERIVRPEGPWVVDVVRIERTTERVAVAPTLARGKVLGRSTVREQLPPATVTERPIAAVNADFFTMAGPEAGVPRGLHVEAGRLVHAASTCPTAFLGPGGAIEFGDARLRAALTAADGSTASIEAVNQAAPEGALALYTSDFAPDAFEPSGVSVIVRLSGLPVRPNCELAGEVVRIAAAGPVAVPADGAVLAGSGAAVAFLESLAAGEAVRLTVRVEGMPEWCTGAVGGGPMLIHAGAAVPTDNPRHPRTAIAYNEREILLVTVDGRQPGWSVGVDFAELARILLDLGCTEALNLDGGGSTTCWVRGTVRNRPSDGSPRPVANGLAVVLTGPVGPAVRLEVEPREVWGLPGARGSLRVEATDADWNPVPAEQVAVSATGTASVLADGHVALDAPGEATLTVSAGALTQRVPVRVVAGPSTLRLSSSEPIAAPGDRLTLALEALGPNGQSLLVPDTMAPDVAVDPALGTAALGRDGTIEIAVAETASDGAVSVRAMGASATASVRVAGPVPLLDGSSLEPVRFTSFPQENAPTGALRLATEADGNAFVAMDYALGSANATRAAYARLDRDLGRVLGFSVRLRCEGPDPWVRLAYIDGNGTRTTVSIAERLSAAEGAWRTFRVRLPDGVKAPVRLESVYVVETDAARRPSGTLCLDDLTAYVLADDPEAAAASEVGKAA